MKKNKSQCPFCGGSKIKPFIGNHVSQNCTECDKDGYIKNSRLEELELFGMIEKPKSLRDRLNSKEKKIYDSVLSNFPATKPESAYNVAIQNGIKFHFIPK